MTNTKAERVKEFQQLLAKTGLDGFLVTNKLDQSFLTGYDMDGYLLLVGRKKAWAFLPQMLAEQFRKIVPFIEAVVVTEFRPAVLEKIEKNGLKKTAFDPSALTYASGKFWKKKGLCEQEGLISGMREIKKGSELSALRKSCHIAAEAFRVLRPKIKPGMTEHSVMLDLIHTMQRMGAKGPSFDIIVAAGANAALPHHCTSQRKIKNNEALLIDFGCVYEGYHSDITKTFFVGRPTDEFKKVYSIVERAQKAGIAAVRNGVKAFDCDKACRDVITEAGYGKMFIHSTGHGVGLEIHELPRLSTLSTAILKTGMTVTVEPGIYLNGKFGVRIEDSVLVTDKGCEILTK